MEPIAEAQRMLDVFASVGASRFAFTKTNIHGEKRGYFGNRTLEEAKQTIEILLRRLGQNNLMVRPYGGQLIQLDVITPRRSTFAARAIA